MPPSIRWRSHHSTGGKTPGIAALAITASIAVPRARRTSLPVRTSVAVTWKGTAACSRRSNSMCSASSSRSPRSGTRYLRAPKNPKKPVSGFRGKTCPRPSRRQISARSSGGCVNGCEAMKAPFTAPTDVPTTRSGSIPRSYRALSIPTWIAPKAAPPDRTKAVCGPLLMTCLRPLPERSYQLRPGEPAPLNSGPRSGADDCAVDDVGHQHHGRGAGPIVEKQKPRGLEQRSRMGGAERRAHSWVDQGQKNTDQGRGGKEGVGDPEQGAEPPAGLTERSEDHVVDPGEQQPEDEMQGVAEGAGPSAVSGERRAQEERQIDPRQSELRGRPQSRGQN